MNDYMEVLVKETVTLHKVLSRYLSTPVVEVRVTANLDDFTSLTRSSGCSM